VPRASAVAAATPALPRPAAGGAATLARLFWDRVALTPGADAHIVKRGGTWTRRTWAEVAAGVGEIACGLLALGRNAGDAVGLLARSRTEWVEADAAILSAGCVTVPIYPTSTVDEIVYIAGDADVRTLIVECGQALARALEAWTRLPRVEHLVVVGGTAKPGARVITWDAVREQGRAPELRRALEARLAATRADDVATIVYTSGTTGVPKGVVQTHGNHLAMLRALATLPEVQPGDVHLLFLPLAHAFARVEAWLAVHRGLVTAFCEDFTRIADDLKQVRPDFLFAVPRLFERAHARILAAVGAGALPRRLLFRLALAVARGAFALEESAIPVPWALRLARALADRLVLRRVRAVFGGRLRFAVSGGAPLGRELGEFFHAIGLPIVEGYGLTEACPALTWNRLDRFKLGSVGQALPGVELRLAADGEVLARAPNVARGYLGKPEETAATFDADGWLHTGDVGRIDEGGFLFIVDRKKDLIVTSSGLNVAPQPIEAALRKAPLVDDAMVHGDRRPYLTALLTLDADAVARVAREHGVAGEDGAALARHPAVVARVQESVDATNATLPSHARIRRFAIAPAPFTEARGELTPTQKIKRRVVAAHHAALLDALYR
jgi:long-chain acyl-CoA synthetase